MRKRVVLGISGGIAAYKSLKLITFLKKEGVEVFVIMTKSATNMVDPFEFEKASGNKVYTELFEKGFGYKDILKHRKVDHIELADKANVFAVAPATANIIAKIAHGLADDFLTTTLLATQAPILICPSMNVNMWRNQLVRENVSKLKKLGYHIVEPESGILACGYEGEGRLPHIKSIRDEIMRLLQSSTSLKGKNVLVTAGGTKEYIDDVRFVTANSSGKMGAAIADECRRRGAHVFLVRAKNAVAPRYTMRELFFETAEELSRIIEGHVGQYQLLFHTAAVSDFKVARKRSGKLTSKQQFSVQFSPREKIIDRIKHWNPKITLIGFKAEFGLPKNVISQSVMEKFKEARVDVMVVNDVSKSDRGFGADTNEVFIVRKYGSYKRIPLAPKREIAREIVDFTIEEFL